MSIGKNWRYINEYKGELFGVEVEVEAKRFALDYLYENEDWIIKDDGSLRGFSFEAVTNKPENKQKTIEKINTLYDLIPKNTIKKGFRSGIHVHYNQSHKEEIDILKTIVCFMIAEDFLVKWCGNNREGNMFCLSSSYAEQQLFSVGECIRNHLLGLNTLNTTSKYWSRYSATNIRSLSKFGTIEWRALETEETPDKLIKFLDILSAIENFSQRYTIKELLKRKTKVDLINLVCNHVGDIEELDRIYLETLNKSLILDLYLHPREKEEKEPKNLYKVFNVDENPLNQNPAGQGPMRVINRRLNRQQIIIDDEFEVEVE